MGVCIQYTRACVNLIIGSWFRLAGENMSLRVSSLATQVAHLVVLVSRRGAGPWDAGSGSGMGWVLVSGPGALPVEVMPSGSMLQGGLYHSSHTQSQCPQARSRALPPNYPSTPHRPPSRCPQAQHCEGSEAIQPGLRTPRSSSGERINRGLIATSSSPRAGAPRPCTPPRT